MIHKILTIALCVVLFASCGARKNRVKNTSPNDVIVGQTAGSDNYSISNLDYHSFSGRAKAKVEFDGNKQDVTLNIRMERNQSIWVSLTATFLNVEGARVLITPDSIKIINKLQGEYIAKPFNYIHRYTGQAITFSLLQDLILANVSSNLLRTDQLTVAKATDEVQIAGVKDDLSFQYSLNEKYRPRVFRVSLLGTDQTLEAYYGSFNEVTGYNFPQNQNIKFMTSLLSVDALLDYNKIEFNQPVEMPFKVPEKYKVLN